MLRVRFCVSALLLFAFANAALATSSAPEGEFLMRITEFKKRIESAGSNAKRLEMLGLYKAYLKGEALSLNPADRDTKRKLRLSIYSLEHYLDLLDRHHFSPSATKSQCEDLRSEIRFSANPRNDPPGFLPGAADEVLSVLEILCKGAT